MKTCFVVQGFGEKTDMASGRTLNLDASYEVIREAVTAAGLRCIRADEIVHSGTIDAPMYEAILRSDLVVADLSTSNLNAAYELGVRYGLRPGGTIIVAERGFQNPFDVSHIVIRRYEHLGKDVGRQEAARFVRELSAAIRAIAGSQAVDSPVYTFLTRLQPPVERAADTSAPAAAAQADRVASAEALPEQSAKALLDAARAQSARGEYAAARALFDVVHGMRPHDPFVVQQLALATYKAAEPDPRTALDSARERLRTLSPDTTNDPETLGLWGAVHKRLWDLTEDPGHLETAISAYERGFHLKQDYYNGINLAYLLNLRASLAAGRGDRPEAVTDFVLARRVRRQVVQYCEAAQASADDGEAYWIAATLWEASVGLEDPTAAERWKGEAERLATTPRMMETTRRQLERLQALLGTSPLAGL